MSNMHNISLLDHEFQTLRVSALTNACAISPFVHEVTIGPNVTLSDRKKNEVRERSIGKSPKDKPNTNGHKHDHHEEFVYTQCGTMTLDRFLHDKEIQRREAVNQSLNNMLSRMANKRAKMMSQFWQQQELEYEQRFREHQAREMEILQEWAKDDRIAQIEEEKLNRENKAHSERMKKLLEKQLESTKLIERLNLSYTRISESHKEISHIIISDEINGLRILKKYESRLITILSSTSALIEKCKSGIVTVEEVTKASELEIDIEELKNQINLNIMSARDQTKIQKPVPVIVKPIESEVKQPVVKIKPEIVKIEPVQKATETNQYCSKKSFDNYMELQEYLINYENSYRQLLEDPSMKKFRFDCQKAVNTPVNAISSLSGEHIKDKYDKLSRLLNGDRVIVGDAYVSAGLHPLGKAYCKDVLASKIVQQGELLVSSNPEAAFPIASVVIALWAQFPEFGKLLCARFQKRCPYIVPMMMPQITGRNIEEFYKSRGYIYDKNGAVEKQDKFLKRMSGIFRLYAAIWVTKMPYSVKAPHPHNISFAWRWLAAFVNLNPEVDITPTLLYDFFTVCGSHCYKYFKIQFAKTLKYLLTDYLMELNKIDTGGPKTRLDVLIQDIINKGCIAPPAGLQSTATW